MLPGSHARPGSKGGGVKSTSDGMVTLKKSTGTGAVVELCLENTPCHGLWEKLVSQLELVSLTTTAPPAVGGFLPTEHLRWATCQES